MADFKRDPRELTDNLELILPQYDEIVDVQDLDKNFVKLDKLLSGERVENSKGEPIEIEIHADTIRYFNEDPMPAAVGGLKAGHVFVDSQDRTKGEQIDQIFDKLFYPPIMPTISISGNPGAGVKEVSSTKFDPTFTIRVTAKNRTLVSVYLQQGSSNIGNNLISAFDTKTGGTTTTKLAASVDVSKPKSISYRAQVIDEEPQTATSGTLSYQWVEPYFYGVVASAPTTSAQVRGLTKLIQAKGTKTLTFVPTADKGRFCIAYPKSHGALKSALDWNKFENINDFTQTTVKVQSPDGASTTVDYYVYTYNNIVLPNPAGLAMTFSY